MARRASSTASNSRRRQGFRDRPDRTPGARRPSLDVRRAPACDSRDKRRSTMRNAIRWRYRAPRVTVGLSAVLVSSTRGRQAMKKLINSPETVVTDALAGMAAAHPALSVYIENKVVIRADAPTA